jgi:kinesin family member 23
LLYYLSNYLTQNDFPSIDLHSCQDDITIKRLIDYLEDRQKKRETLIHETQEINKFLFQIISNLIDTNDKLLNENQELKQRIELKERNENKMDSKIKALEKVINKTPFNKEANNNEFIERRKFKDIENINPALMSSNSQTPTYRSNKLIHLTPSTGSSGSIGIGRPHVPPLPPLSTPSSIGPSTTSSAKVSSIYTQHLASQQHQQQYLRSPIRRDGIPVGNRRAQRRSKSADMWLDHKPPNTTKTDTVLQPKMTRKRSVSRVELNDAKKSSKYVLTHQHQDKDDELVTNLIRGDILKSPSGGANVIFTDIETLKQQDMPLAKKRRSTTNGDDCLINDKAVIEDRCSLAIEGHSARTPRQTTKFIK